MFGLGTSEILVILLVALLVLGPQKLPGIARTLGKTLGEFRRVSTEFQRTLNAEVEMVELEKNKNTATDAVSAPQKQAVAGESVVQNKESVSPGNENVPDGISPQEPMQSAPYANQDANKKA